MAGSDMLTDGAKINSADGAASRLHYAQPATRWLSALPVGNGRLGAMVYGGTSEEVLGLNDVTFWSGAPDDRHVNPKGRAAFDKIRELFRAGRTDGVMALVSDVLGRQSNYGTSLPAGQLVIRQAGADGAVTDYVRDLDLERAVASVNFTAAGVRYRREVIASHPAGIVAIRLTADRAAGLSVELSYRANALPWTSRADGADLVISGDARESRQSDGKSGVGFSARFSVIAEGGKVHAGDGAIHIEGADSATILVALNTDMFDANPAARCDEQIKAARLVGWERLLAQHVADHRTLYDRMFINIAGPEDRTALATDQRLERQRKGEADPQLAALFFQYGRYLTIAGSRADSPLPLHLQGIWNDGLAAGMAWTCDYHFDINTQQNYWLSEVGNLSECGLPLFRLVAGLRESGERTARDLYGVQRGWVAHIFTNAWGFTAPGWGRGWGMHVTGGAWIATHLWEHYLYTGSRTFLAETAYPVLKGMAEFFLDYLFVDPASGFLLTGPSVSPEIGGEDRPGNTHDTAMIRALFGSAMEAAKVLGVDAALVAELAGAQSKLPPFKIGRNGQLQEWFSVDDGGETGHRHTSHLAALYPLRQITPAATPELAAAALRSLELRMSHPGWEDVEWSAANAVCYHTALRDGDRAHGALLNLLNDDTDVSLLTFSRGGIAGAADNIFSIDGNMAGAAGIAEMLMQSDGEVIELLPALPGAWPSGKITGLRARGGLEVDLEWRNGQVSSYRVTSAQPRKVTVRFGGKSVEVATGASVDA